MNFEPTLTHGIIFSDLVIREEGSGKNSFIGSFQTFNLPQFPVPVMPFFITVCLTNLIGEIKSLHVTARIENPQTGMVLINSGVGIAFKSEPGREEVFELPLPIVGLVFPSAGNYKAVILVNNEKIGERDLPVRQVTAPTQK